jgi:hypothetical protein
VLHFKDSEERKYVEGRIERTWSKSQSNNEDDIVDDDLRNDDPDGYPIPI